MSTTSRGPSRRTLVKGAAWSVPVVAVAGAAPALASSPPVVVEPDYSSGVCKHPGNPKWYHFNFCFTNNGASQVTIYIDSMVINGVTMEQVIPAQIVLDAGESCCRSVDGGLADDSANGTGTIAFSWVYAGGETGNGAATMTANDLPPCGTGADPGGNPGGDPPHTGESC